ncbi:hypothetical protein MFRU_008g03860 [Monilinia fructicola]|uniref:Spherulation-specific family 4 n=1 Tax=Monilinia fructicola TaxID=38448 RepID=A0A5M9J8Y2_MONFR|nr:hypothetical protein EYC84_010545 [Monilinia fructicola]KAG4032036.1 hypothetical protein MFRU_008g03860 [Monilinia fructicola]
MVLATSILLPLYLFPTQGAWNWVTNAISAYPSLPFTIIVNPNSGPGATNAYPETEYINGITNLTKHDNVKLLGYVDTRYMEKDTATVDQEVETYKYWSTYTKGDIAVDGIFFDDAVNEWTSTSSTYMTAIANHAHSLNLTVTFNPGTIADAQFFDIADKIVMIEDAYSSYSSGTGDSLKQISNGQGDKSSVILYQFSGSSAQQTSTVDSIVNSGVSEIYITTVEYTSQSSMWTQFVAAVNNAISK